MRSTRERADEATFQTMFEYPFPAAQPGILTQVQGPNNAV